MVLTPAVAAPPSNIPPADKDVVPPGLTRVTVIHEIDRTRTIVDHGPGIVPPPRQQTSFACTDATQDTCDTNSFTGKKWFILPVNYYVNLEGSGDDGNFLEAVIAGSQVWEDGANSSFEQEFIDVTDLQASGAQQRKMDGFNVVDWGNTKKFGFSVIAVTVFWYFTSTGQIVEADFRYNQDFSWSSNGGPADPRDPDTDFGILTAMDVQNIGAHEFGHFHAALFDITDSSASALTMYAFGALGETQKRDLGVGDQISIETAYPPTITPPPPNDPPTANPDSDTTPEDTAVTVTMTGSYIDGDSLTFTIDTPPTNGALGAITQLTPTSAEVTYTPDPDFNGADSFVFQVDDSNDGVDTATFDLTVTPVNDDPVANPDSDTTPEDTAVTVTMTGSDIDGDSLTFTIDTPPTNGALGAITQLTPTSAEVTYTPDPDFNEADSFVFQVDDSNGGVDTATFDLTVTVNNPSAGVSVDSIRYDTHGGRDGLKHLDITIALLDDFLIPVSGASVSIDLFRDSSFVAQGTGTTETDGTVTFTLNNASPGLYTTIVTDVTAAGLTWDDGVTPFNEFPK